MRKLTDKYRKQFFPFKTSDGFECVPVTSKELYKFVGKNFTEVFGQKFSHHYQAPKAIMRKMKPIRTAYAKIHHEFFFFKKGKVIVGWCFGEMDDFETFYMRNTGLLPEYRQRKIYGEFLEQFLRYIQALGYQRVSSQHHPDNYAILKTKLKAGFIITGTENHERYGQLLKMIRIFDSDRERYFKKKYL